MKWVLFVVILLSLPHMSTLAEQSNTQPNNADKNMEEQRYQQLLDCDWKPVFEDTCTEDWHDKWTLDGEKARVTNSKDGMDFHAGPTAFDDACHAVLWTKDSFAGDLKIEYEYTRLDDAVRFVNILYVQATGSGQQPYDEDIAKWAGLRRTPAMSLYFNHMNTLHVSYAAFDGNNEDPDNDYIRSRRYMPETGKGLDGTDLPPDNYTHTGLFKTGEPHKITVIKTGDRLYMHVENDSGETLCYWKTDALPPIDHGRIGLRQMYTRSARYKNIRIYTRPE